MDDRELLELAAKAAGLEWYGFYGDDEAECKYLDIGPNDVEPWNPITDDGAALRLAVRLRMNIEIDSLETHAVVRKRGALAAFEPQSVGPVDESAATRRAIVRAAANIGKEMK